MSFVRAIEWTATIFTSSATKAIAALKFLALIASQKPCTIAAGSFAVEFEAGTGVEIEMAVGVGAGAPVLFQRGDLVTRQFLSHASSLHFVNTESLSVHSVTPLIRKFHHNNLAIIIDLKFARAICKLSTVIVNFLIECDRVTGDRLQITDLKGYSSFRFR